MQDAGCRLQVGGWWCVVRGVKCGVRRCVRCFGAAGWLGVGENAWEKDRGGKA